MTDVKLPIAVESARDMIAEDAFDEAFKVIANGLSDLGYDVTGDVAPDAYHAALETFLGWVDMMALNNDEIAALNEAGGEENA